MIFSLKVAIRFLLSNKGQTILIALGIAIGISVQIFIGSLIQGLQRDLIDKTVGTSPHIYVIADKNKSVIENYKTQVDKAKIMNGIKYVSTAVDRNAFIKTIEGNYTVLVRGFDLEEANNIYKLKDRIIEGHLPTNDNQILIGKKLKEEANLKVGEIYKMVTPEGVKKDYIVAGVFDLKVASINRSWVITKTNVAQDLFNLKDKITSIEIQVNDVFLADTIASDFEKDFTFANLGIKNWKSENEQLLSGLDGQTISSIMIQTFVMISVVLGISSVLAISVSQKSRQIGILKAMGITNKKASLIFLFQGLMLGILGAILGIVLGIGLLYVFTTFAVGSDGAPIIAIFIDPNFILLSGLIAILASSIASVIPAFKSSRLDPMEVIRNG